MRDWRLAWDDESGLLRGENKTRTVAHGNVNQAVSTGIKLPPLIMGQSNETRFIEYLQGIIGCDTYGKINDNVREAVSSSRWCFFAKANRRGS